MNDILLSFSSSHDGINVKMRLRNRIPFTILPTPREVHASCGISIRVRAENFEAVQALLDSLGMGGDRVLLHFVVNDGGKNSYLPL